MMKTDTQQAKANAQTAGLLARCYCMSSQPEVTQTDTETPCPKCKKGTLAVLTNAAGIVVQEICSACEFVNEVLEHKTKHESTAEIN